MPILIVVHGVVNADKTYNEPDGRNREKTLKCRAVRLRFEQPL